MTRSIPNIALAINILSWPLFCNARSTRWQKRADGGILTQNDKDAMLNLYNEQRSATALGNTGSQPMATNMIELIWDESLAEGSKEHADRCVFAHGDSEFGENLFARFSGTDTIDNINVFLDGISFWYDEHEFYTFSDASCESLKVCGHYTQNIWANTQKVGCGYAECEDMLSSDYPFEILLVCRYEPPGNYIGELPYEEASDSSQIASNCPNGYTGDSVSGLCKVIASTPAPTTFTPAPTTFTPAPTASTLISLIYTCSDCLSCT